MGDNLYQGGGRGREGEDVRRGISIYFRVRKKGAGIKLRNWGGTEGSKEKIT